MKKIKAIIEKGNDGLYSIYLPDVPGMYGTGETETEAKESLYDAVDSAKEYVEDIGKWGEYVVFRSDFEFEYRYDLSGFFKSFNFFDVSALAGKIGLNASLLRRYKSGISKAETKQKEKIEQGIHNLANELSNVKF
jgi:predicted RNase H-like HicB family nuclease